MPIIVFIHHITYLLKMLFMADPG